MSTEQNTAVARRVTFDLFQGGNLTLLEPLTTDDFRNEGQTAGPAEGRANLANAITRVRGAFPDLEYTLEHELSDGDFVVHHLRAHGTHLGPLGPYAPTGKVAHWREMHLMHFRDGRLLEQWGIVDRLAILQQLELL